MTDAINSRKIQHIRIIRRDRKTDRDMRWFDLIHLRHRALPELSLKEIDPSTTFLGKQLSFPLLISSMTGGDHAMLRRINRNLALAAESEGVALAVGSQRVMLGRPRAEESFELRRHAPSTLLFANLGAVQLNCGCGIDECRRAVETVGADALYLHLNPLQEAVQPEGDTDFRGLAKKIGEIARKLPVPVAVKEVGAGIGPDDARLLLRNGVKIIDVAGSGGTSWSRIEHFRKDADDEDNLGLLFQDWGTPTPQALLELAPIRGRASLIASGGLRSGVDMAKAVALGASLCGLAAPFLEPALESADAVRSVIRRLRREFVTALFLTGAGSVRALTGNRRFIASVHAP